MEKGNYFKYGIGTPRNIIDWPRGCGHSMRMYITQPDMAIIVNCRTVILSLNISGLIKKVHTVQTTKYVRSLNDPNFIPREAHFLHRCIMLRLRSRAGITVLSSRPMATSTSAILQSRRPVERVRDLGYRHGRRCCCRRRDRPRDRDVGPVGRRRPRRGMRGFVTPGAQFNRHNFGLSFGLKNHLSFGLRIHPYSRKMFKNG